MKLPVRSWPASRSFCGVTIARDGVSCGDILNSDSCGQMDVDGIFSSGCRLHSMVPDEQCLLQLLMQSPCTGCCPTLEETQMLRARQVLTWLLRQLPRHLEGARLPCAAAACRCRLRCALPLG